MGTGAAQRGVKGCESTKGFANRTKLSWERKGKGRGGKRTKGKRKRNANEEGRGEGKRRRFRFAVCTLPTSVTVGENADLKLKNMSKDPLNSRTPSRRKEDEPWRQPVVADADDGHLGAVNHLNYFPDSSPAK